MAKKQIISEYDEIDLEDYPPVYAECRDILHAWSILGYYVNGGEPYRKEKCVRCGMGKRRHLVPGGKSSYQQPEGYRLPGVSRQEFRDLAWKHADVYESEEDLIEVLAAEASRKRQRRRSA